MAHLGEVADPPKQPVGDPRRAARAARDLRGPLLVESHLEDARRSPHDPGEVVDRVVVEPRREPESFPQGQRDAPGPGRRRHEGEPGQLEPDRPRGRALAQHDVEHEVLERRVEHLFDRPRHAVHLVDEEHVAVVEVREDRRQVARAVEGRAARGLEPGAHRVRDDLGERRLAETGRSAEQQVVDGLAAAAGAVDQQLQLFLHALLADEVAERLSAAARRRTRGPRDRRRRPRSGDRRPSQRPTFCRASRSRSSTSRPSASTSRVASAASCGREAERARAPRARRRSARLARKLRLAAEPVAELHDDALRDLLADPGHDRERVGVAGDHRTSERVGAHRRQERQSDLRPDARHAREQIEERSLVGRGEAVQRHRVVAHDHARVHAGSVPDGRQATRATDVGTDTS